MYLFLFRRDLRWYDNTSLIELYKLYKQDSNPNKLIMTCFIYDPIQINNNEYFSPSAFHFIIESLIDLKKNAKIPFFIFYGNPITILNKIHSIEKISHLACNMDYSPFSIKRDSDISNWCIKNSIQFIYKEDLLLLPIQSYHHKPFLKFTPFRNHNWIKNIQKPNQYSFQSISLSDSFSKKFNSILVTDLFFPLKKYKLPPSLIVKGGRTFSLSLLNNLKNQSNYGKYRNCLNYQTSLLSSSLSFGCLSIREVFYKIRSLFNKYSSLESELWWRDFYFYLMYHFPHIIGSYYNQKWIHMTWSNKYWYSIIDIKTGFPIIDAAITQLYKTGWMHNRARMFVTSFMAKDLNISPLLIEKWWATHLIDYCVSSTNGGVSWTVGYGIDSMMPFRIFNPWIQSKKYDPNAIYIKKWLPILENIPSNHLHQWNIYYSNYPNISYPKPIIDHNLAKNNFLSLYKQKIKN